MVFVTYIVGYVAYLGISINTTCQPDIHIYIPNCTYIPRYLPYSLPTSCQLLYAPIATEVHIYTYVGRAVDDKYTYGLV